MFPRKAKTYRLKIIFIHDPHFIWATYHDSYWAVDLPQRFYFQIGQYEILPCKTNRSPNTIGDNCWSLHAISKFKNAIEFSKAVYYTPVWYNRKHAALPESTASFGYISIINQNGVRYSVEDLLLEHGYGYKTSLFREIMAISGPYAFPDPAQLIIIRFELTSFFKKEFFPLDTISKTTAAVFFYSIPLLLVHTNMEEVGSLYREIYENLEFEEVITTPMTSVEIAAQPPVRGAHSVFSIGPAKYRINSSILSPLTDMLICKLYDSDHGSIGGPVILAICPTGKITKEVEHTFNMLLDDTNFARVLRCDSDTLNFDYQYQEVDVLVVSMNFMSSLLKHKYDMERLEHVVLIEMQKVEPYEESVNMIIEFIRQDHIKVHGTATTFTPFLKTVCVESVDPWVNVVTEKEILNYSYGLKLTLNFIDNEDKIFHLINRILKNKTYKKTVIFCNNDCEVITIVDNLNSICQDIKVFWLTSQAETEEYYNANLEWLKSNNSRQSILICTDEMERRMNARNADQIIFYSMCKNYSILDKRIKVIIESGPSMWVEPNLTVSMEIYVNGGNSFQWLYVYNLAQRFKVQFNEETLQEIDKIKRILEDSYPICRELLNFGDCKIEDCDSRHWLKHNADKLYDWIPASGTIKCVPLFMFNPIHYSVRLLEHVDTNGKITYFDHPQLPVLVEMAKFYSANYNRNILSDPQPGKICAIKTDLFRRCEIISVKPSNTEEIFADIFLIDDGQTLSVSASDLYELPKFLLNVNSNVINLKLTGISPNDFDSDWNDTAINQMEIILKEYEGKYYMEGTIVLGLKDTLWVETLNFCSKTVNSQVIIVNVNENILKNKIGTANYCHLELLHSFFDKNAFEYPTYEKEITVKFIKKNILPDPIWLKLEDNTFNMVKYCNAVSIDTVFLSLIAWDNALLALTKQLKSHVRSCNDNELMLFNIGDFCVAKYMETEYARVRIDQVLHEGKIYDCFYVDYGMSQIIRREDVYPITGKLLIQIPFQAIECKMFGLNNLSTQSTDMMSFISNVDNKPKLLFAFNVVEEEATYTEGTKYSIALFDNVEMINMALVKNFLAKFVNMEEFQKLLTTIDKFSEFMDMFDDHNKNSANPTWKNNANILNLTANQRYSSGMREKWQSENNTELNILWHEDDCYIFLKIQLKNVTDYEMNITKFGMHFETILENKLNMFRFDFFGNVLADESIHYAGEDYVEVKLVKICPLLWNELTSDDKPKWIQSDPEYSMTETDKEEYSNPNWWKEMVEKQNNYLIEHRKHFDYPHFNANYSYGYNQNLSDIE